MQLTFSGRIQVFDLKQPTFSGSADNPHAGNIGSIDTPNAFREEVEGRVEAWRFRLGVRVSVGRLGLSLLGRDTWRLSSTPRASHANGGGGVTTKTILFEASDRLFVVDGTTKANLMLRSSTRKGVTSSPRMARASIFNHEKLTENSESLKDGDRRTCTIIACLGRDG